MLEMEPSLPEKHLGRVEDPDKMPKLPRRHAPVDDRWHGGFASSWRGVAMALPFVEREKYRRNVNSRKSSGKRRS